jgi:SAM-dependent methyltransferase
MFGQQYFTLTKNSHGVMHAMNSISKAFVSHALHCTGTVLDIGAAYGIATIPILKGNPNVHVIACDISKKHLEELAVSVNKIEEEDGVLLSNRLTLLDKKFPYFDLEENSVDAILASHVLPFLTGKEIEEGINKLAKFLKPGGVLYVSSYSIYNKVMRGYIETYEKRKEAGNPWPGEIEDASLFWDVSNPLTAILPKKLNHLEPCLIESLIKENNFKIKYLDFMSLVEEIPEDMKLDGRETMGLIAAQIK